MSRQQCGERRKYIRYQAKENLVAFDSKSFRRVENISMAGMGYVALVSRRYSLPEFLKMGILSATADTYIDNLQCQVVNVGLLDSHEHNSRLASTRIVRVAVQFKWLTLLQQDQLASFIAVNSTGRCSAQLQN